MARAWRTAGWDLTHLSKTNHILINWLGYLLVIDTIPRISPFMCQLTRSSPQGTRDANSRWEFLPHIFSSQASQICKIFYLFCKSNDVIVVDCLQKAKNMVSSSSPITSLDKSCQSMMNVCPKFIRLHCCET